MKREEEIIKKEDNKMKKIAITEIVGGLCQLFA
jgi:hypothetical protein